MTAALHDDYPAPGDWTTVDLDRLPDDGHRRELLDGQPLVSLSPTRLHQSIALQLGAALLVGDRHPAGSDRPAHPLT